MKIEALSSIDLDAFKVYCKKHRSEVDVSYLSDEDLDNFKIGRENPTCVIKDEIGNIVAAASLVVDDYHRAGKRGRFRILHSELVNNEYYQKMLDYIINNVSGIEHVIVFIPMQHKGLISSIEALKFKVERYSFILTRPVAEIPAYSIPSGYNLIPFRNGIDEQTWCDVRNPSFATLKGSEVPLKVENVVSMISQSDCLEGGAMILFHGDKAVGVVRGYDDELDDGTSAMGIGPLAIIPEYQGKGLGRILLRAAMEFAKSKNYPKVCLCVNGENERAKALYLQEGFIEDEAVVCYKYCL